MRSRFVLPILAALLPGVVLAQPAPSLPNPAYFRPRGLPPATAENTTFMAHPDVRQALPHLRPGTYAIVSAQTRRYNAYSHVIGDYSRWTDPGDKVSEMDGLFRRHGYIRVQGMPVAPDYRVDKIVLYGQRGRDGAITATSAARVERIGYTTKLGAGPLIWHARLESLSGPLYGQPVHVYVRPRQAPRR